MAVNLDALKVVNPALAGSLDNKLSETAQVHRVQSAAAATSDASLGFAPAPPVPGGQLIGSFPCEIGPYSTRDGKQIQSGDGVVVTQPWQVVLRATDGALMKARDRITVNQQTFSVLVPPQIGTFDVLVTAICQQVLS